ncbi:MAG: ABC transporter ATP-binding protein [Chloroflexi bacterium]|nr:ABC transporter ATP-binding protein [Chloroflexota bacterium]
MTLPSRSEAVAAHRISDGAPLLEVKNLHTHFFTGEGIVLAVDGASFEVHAGKTLGLVGESGCGKSVAAKSILQIVDKPGRVVDGEILYTSQVSAGQEIRRDLLKLDAGGSEMRAIRGGEISMIFQEPMSSFSPVHTVGNQLMEAIQLHTEMSDKEAEETAIQWLRHVGIPNPTQRLNEFPYRLSGGQCQRAMIAMALSTNPRILIADEPTTALDVTTQAQILNLLQRLQAETGMAMIFITHDLGVIAEVADEVAVMYLGRMVEKAPVKEIFRNPKHPYTKALLTSIPRIDAQPRERLPSIKGSIPHPQNRPSSCPFHPRCPAFIPGTCDQKEPQLAPVGENHQASCFLYPGC